jgi:hypothetical protein
MRLDTEFLRRHYAEMSDEELREVNRDDLVEAARAIYDEEVAGRRESAEPAAVRRVAAPQDDEVELDWMEDAAEAYSSYARQGSMDPSEGSLEARHALEDAGIPCHLELIEEPGDDGRPMHRWRVLVPGKLIHRATSVIDRDIFNPEFEAQWRAHLEILSDDELRVMEPQYAFCGLYDRLERINRAYDEELRRRGIEE